MFVQKKKKKEAAILTNAFTKVCHKKATVTATGGHGNFASGGGIGRTRNTETVGIRGIKVRGAGRAGAVEPLVPGEAEAVIQGARSHGGSEGGKRAVLAHLVSVGVLVHVLGAG